MGLGPIHFFIDREKKKKKKQSSRALQIHSVPLSTVSIQQPTAIQHFSLLKKILQQTRKSNNTDQCIKDVKNTDLTAFQLDCTGFTVRLLLCLFCASEQKHTQSEDWYPHFFVSVTLCLYLKHNV